MAETDKASARFFRGPLQASPSSCKCHSKLNLSPEILGRENILRTLTQICVVLCNFMELIQVKFLWESQAQGQEQEVVRVTWGHRGIGGGQRGPEKEEDMQKVRLGRLLKTRVSHSTSGTFDRILLLGGGHSERPQDTRKYRQCSWRLGQGESDRSCTDKPQQIHLRPHGKVLH